MFPTRKLLSLVDPHPEVPLDLVQFAPGKIMRTDGLDVDGTLAVFAAEFNKAETDTQRRQMHGLFHRTASVSDLTPALYERFSRNPNSMAYWLPKVVAANNAAAQANADTQANTAGHAPFAIPETTIWRLPIELAQFIRIEYAQTNQISRETFNKLVASAFNLQEGHTYFIKTGVFSSKFEFANAKCSEPEEMGEYFQVINNIAMMLGAGETVDLVVREYIEDVEDNPTIYHGMPLRTEYRAFVDFDHCDTATNQPRPRVLGITPYWHPSVMEKALALASSDVGAHFGHITDDYHTYRAHKDQLMAKFHDHRDDVLDRLNTLLLPLYGQGMRGQWSLDVMKNGDQFYLIDLALMCESALADLLTVTDEYATVEPTVISEFADQLFIDYERFDHTFDTDYPAGIYRSHGGSMVTP